MPMEKAELIEAIKACWPVDNLPDRQTIATFLNCGDENIIDHLEPSQLYCWTDYDARAISPIFIFLEPDLLQCYIGPMLVVSLRYGWDCDVMADTLGNQLPSYIADKSISEERRTLMQHRLIQEMFALRD